MGKFKIAISFDTKFLNSLKDTEKSGVEIQRRQHHLALHPIHLNKFNESIKELLKDGVAKYSKELNGILLGYQNIKLLSGRGVLHDDSCYNHFDIEADFFVFKPEVGKEMQGVVTRISKDHVGLLVYNTFNVSLPDPHDQDDWLGKSVQIGYKVLFRIVHFSFTSYLPYIKGELISILTELENGITSTNNTSPRKSKKASKKIHFGDDSISQEIPGEESTPNEVHQELNESRKKKKSKKDKLRSLDSDNDFSFGELIESESKEKEDSFFNVSSMKEKRTKKVKLEEPVSDFENSLNLSGSKKAKKRKNSESEMSGSPKKKKKRLICEME